jgi:hypothetical protein
LRGAGLVSDLELRLIEVSGRYQGVLSDPAVLSRRGSL